MEWYAAELREIWLTIKQELKKFSPLRTEIGNKLGVTGIQLMALHYINFNINCKTSDISTHLFVSPSDATRIVDVLVQKEFVERVNDEKDRRVIRLKLTNKGTETFRAIHRDFDLLLSKILGKMSEEDIKALIKGIKALSHALRELNSEKKVL